MTVNVLWLLSILCITGSDVQLQLKINPVEMFSSQNMFQF